MGHFKDLKAWHLRFAADASRGSEATWTLGSANGLRLAATDGLRLEGALTPCGVADENSTASWLPAPVASNKEMSQSPRRDQPRVWPPPAHPLSAPPPIPTPPHL